MPIDVRGRRHGFGLRICIVLGRANSRHIDLFGVLLAFGLCGFYTVVFGWFVPKIF
jgi:SNF family Na+-dependent transporter